MAAATEKATSCCVENAWSVDASDPSQDQIGKRAAVATLIRPVDPLPQPAANPAAAKGIMA